MQQVTDNVYRIDADALGLYLIVRPQTLTLIDVGFPGTLPAIEAAVARLGRRLEEIGDILLTHAHPDHAAGLAEVKRATGAQVWVHQADAEMVATGQGFRPFTVSPGEYNRAFAAEVISECPLSYEPVPVDHPVSPGEEIPVAGGMTAIGTPGHTLGHIVYLWSGDGGVVFLGDAAKNESTLEPATVYEDLAQGFRDLEHISTYDFEVACFGHGPPIVGGAAAAFRHRWGNDRTSPLPE